MRRLNKNLCRMNLYRMLTVLAGLIVMAATPGQSQAQTITARTGVARGVGSEEWLEDQFSVYFRVSRPFIVDRQPWVC